MPRVILLGLDGFPTRVISPELTPNLWSLAMAGGWSPAGGVSALPSSTYPGFASLITGLEPARHGVLTTTQQAGAVPGWAGSDVVEAPTLFDRLAQAGLRTAAVLGDHDLCKVLRASVASHTWPPGGLPPPGTPLDGHGYVLNREVRPHLLAAAADPGLDFVFGHLNEADTLGHDLGPDHAEAIRCYAETDAIIGEVVAGVRPTWDDTVVIIVSDHDMEPRSQKPPIDLRGMPALRDLVLDSVFDGGAALVLVRPGHAGRVAGVVAAHPGIDSVVEDGERLLLVARPGWRFAPVRSASGYHGGAGTTATVAVVGGGHPAVPLVARRIASERPRLIDWAPTILDVLGLEADETDGVALV